jgi:hypothetical protein
MSTNSMRAAPDLAKLKALLRDIVSHGDQADVANILGCTRKDVSNRFAPESDRKPGLYEGLREAWALSAVNPEAARTLRAFIDGLFDSWLDPVMATEKNLSTLVGDANQEAGDLVRARLENKPARQQREQALALRATVDQFIAGLDNQFELRSETAKFPQRAKG